MGEDHMDSRDLSQTDGGVREPYRRVSLSKVKSFLGGRLRVCRDAADMYAEKATGAERDFYLRMAATERCAACEVRLIYETLTGEDAPKHDTTEQSDRTRDEPHD